MSPHGLHAYRVTVKARKFGAIGHFYKLTRVVHVENRDATHEAAITLLNNEGYETLNVVSVEGRLD